MKTAALRLVVLMLCASCALSQERYSKVRIPVSTQEEVLVLARLGINLEGGSRWTEGHIDVFISDREAQLLKESGVGFTTLIADWYTHYAQRQKQVNQSAAQLLRESGLTNFRLGSMGGFLTFEELRADLDSMRAKYPGLITARDIIGASYEGRPIWAVRIGTAPAGQRPEALYMGLHHADEPAGMMSLVYFMWYLLENYGRDPEVTRVVDTRELWFVPLVNPDGYCYNTLSQPAGGGMWRKNRHPDGTTGFVGVDLNRNYGFNWGFDDYGSSPNGVSDMYRGKAPFSEPETQAVRNFALAHHFTTSHSFHSAGDFVLSPWGYDCTETKDSAFFRMLELDMIAVNRYSFGAEYRYTYNGGSHDWMYGDTVSKPKIYSFIVEVGTDDDGHWPPLSRILPIVKGNIRTNLVLARAAGEYIRVDKPRVTCQFTDDSATISVPFINSGAGTASKTVDVKVSCSDLSIVTSRYSGHAWIDPLKISARKNRPVGTRVSLYLELDYTGGKTIDTVTFRLGPANVIYGDDAEVTRSHWLASSNLNLMWDTTSDQAHSGRLSFSESPRGTYANNLASTFMLDSALVLTGDAAELRFWLKGRTQDDYDYVLVEISTNRGQSWIPLAGRYTSPGPSIVMEKSVQVPILDGYKYEWIEELMDLTEHVGKTVQLRFRFVSNSSRFYDGFYIDDISVLTYLASPYGQDTTVVGVPRDFTLEQNYPNPFNPSTTIEYKLPKASFVNLSVYNVLGQRVAVLVNGIRPAGVFRERFDASGLPSGIYLYRMQAGMFNDTRKLVFQK